MILQMCSLASRILPTDIHYTYSIPTYRQRTFAWIILVIDKCLPCACITNCVGSHELRTLCTFVPWVFKCFHFIYNSPINKRSSDFIFLVDCWCKFHWLRLRSDFNKRPNRLYPSKRLSIFHQCYNAVVKQLAYILRPQKVKMIESGVRHRENTI